LSLIALTGCSNVCNKAGTKYLDCWQQHCEANADDDRCDIALNNQLMQAMRDAESCPNEERAQQIVDQTCDQIIESFGQ